MVAEVVMVVGVAGMVEMAEVAEVAEVAVMEETEVEEAVEVERDGICSSASSRLHGSGHHNLEGCQAHYSGCHHP